MTEAEKERRREVIANNKAWKSSETVRREWLKRFLTRKSAPKGACVYLAGELARGIHELRRGMERSHQLALGVVLGDIEESTGPHSWRNPSDTVRRYFTFLAENGYALSDVEKRAASGPARKRGRGPAAPGNATAAA